MHILNMYLSIPQITLIVNPNFIGEETEAQRSDDPKALQMPGVPVSLSDHISDLPPVPR